MASFIYNPSQKVTELLSEYLEFDPEQLEVGVWSGDLSLKNVNLKREAIHPILNGSNNKKNKNSESAPEQQSSSSESQAKFKKEPLHMKLVKGTVGQMRIRIPWKSLVWGQGAVQLEISDVTIVLSFQSREEMERQEREAVQKKKKKNTNNTGPSTEDDDEAGEGDKTSSAASGWSAHKASKIPGISNKSYRDAKQRRLREAERRQVSGMPMALWLESLNRKNAVVKDAVKLEKAALAASDGHRSSKSSSKSRKEGRMDRFLKNTTSDLFWRFFAGIQGSIKKARIVIVQDGVEVGCIIQSIEVIAGKEGTKVTFMQENAHRDDVLSEMGDSGAAGSSSRHSHSASTGGDHLPPAHYESAYEDGEHVDKTLRQHGIGLFVRKLDTAGAAKVPQQLRFSSSVSADDFVLRPINIDLNFSFFYPYPEERRNKNKRCTTEQDSAGRSGARSVVSDSAATTTSSKRRRGKRDKASPTLPPLQPLEPSSRAHTFGDYETPRRGRLKRSNSSDDAELGISLHLSSVFEGAEIPHNERPQHNPQSRHHRLLATSRAENPLFFDNHYSKSSSIATESGLLSTPIHGSVHPPPISRSASVQRPTSSGVSRVSSSHHASSGVVDTMSIVDSPNVAQVGNRGEPLVVPHLECRIFMDEIKVVFTTRHYELLSYFFSTVTRMKNGRPDRLIRSVKETEPGAAFRRMMTASPVFSPTSNKPTGGAPSSSTGSAAMKATTSTLTNLMGMWGALRKDDEGTREGQEGTNRSPSPSPSEFFKEDLPGQRLKSARQEIVAKWWKYVIGAIVWEVRKRKHMTSVFRKMYISFDWSRQCHRRQEYIDLYIALKLDKNRGTANISSVWSFEEDREKKWSDQEAKLLEIEDGLPLEQILLYRSIARRMRVRGINKMPTTIFEIWGNEKSSGAPPMTMLSRASTKLAGNISPHLKSTNNSSRKRTLGPHLAGPESDSLLALIQHKFMFTKRLREKSGVLERFKLASQFQSPEGSVRANTNDRSVDNLSTEAANFYTPARVPPQMPLQSGMRSLQRHNSIGMDSAAQSSFRANERVSRPRRRISIGTPSICYSDLQAGNFYASGGTKRDSQADGRTIKTNRQWGQSRLTRQTSHGIGTSTLAESTMGPLTDNRMRVFCSFQIKSFELMVVEEDYYFEMSPDMMKMNSASRLMSPAVERDPRVSGEDSSSSRNDLSDLSILTDDEKFFSEEGTIDVIAEEEETDGDGLKLSSEDFLLFGLPENPLLRLTVSSFTTKARGISGGDQQFSLLVGQIEMIGGHETHILTMGELVQQSPVVEVNIESSASNLRQRRSSGTASIDESTLSGRSQQMDELTFLRKAPGQDRRAVSLNFIKDSESKHLRCDFSKVTGSANLGPVDDLLRFYSKSEIKQPERLLTKSSRDVARKIMVQKMSSGQSPLLSGISVAVRVHGMEVRVPFSLKASDSSEASESESSHPRSIAAEGREALDSSVVLAADLLEFYSGRSVDDLIQNSGGAPDGGNAHSVISGSYRSSRRVAASTLKTLGMLDLAELTGTHDSFASTHFVTNIGGLICGTQSESRGLLHLTEYPVDLEVLVTTNDTSLLDTESPKQQVVIEASPIHVVLSEHRLSLLSAAKGALDLGRLDTEGHIKKLRKPDPPRIEILSQRILSSIDFSCKRVRLELVKDRPTSESSLPTNDKELIMEECLSDFLSVVSCFDFSLPNEEALSSAMQVCIGRLVGLGLTDDEAWGCTNAARLNFLDDIALMRTAQSQVMVEMSANKEKSLVREEVFEDVAKDGDINSNDDDASGSVSFIWTESMEKSHQDDSIVGSVEITSVGDSDFSDDDSRNSADIVETTLSNAVEKTVAIFSPLLLEPLGDNIHLNGTTFLVLDLLMGFKLSIVKMFYDDHLALLLTSLVVTNKAGIELMTLVPHVKEAKGSTRDDDLEYSGHGLSFSTFNLDKKYEFGKGGLPMSVLASNKGSDIDVAHRVRSKFNDVDIGELECVFSHAIFDEVIDDISGLTFSSKTPKQGKNNGGLDREWSATNPETSNVVVASSVSLLFATDTLAPFSRLTVESMSYKNDKALESLQMSETPYWALVAKSFTIQNLTPEGQFYPDTLATLSTDVESADFPFQLRYFKSSGPWKINSRLEIDFTGFRLFLIRQFIHEILQYFVYDKFGLGKLRKKHSKDERDVHGNGKPPLLFTIYVYDTSIICPRNSTSCDMVAFEVEDACIAVSYVPETFAMPTESTPFNPNPGGRKGNLPRHEDSDCASHLHMATPQKESFYSIADYEDCASTFSEVSTEPISSHTSNLKRRLTINLDQTRVFTVMAADKTTQDVLQSPSFRVLHEIDGRAEGGKAVYQRRQMLDRNFDADNFAGSEIGMQQWEEISNNTLNVEVLVDYAPHMRLLIGSREGPNPFSLDARLSQLCLLLSVWDSNMQEMPTMFPFSTDQVSHSASPPNIPPDFPEYSTEKFVSYLESIDSVRSEICCIFKQVSLRCTYDAPGFFSRDPDCFQYMKNPRCPDDEKPGLILTIDNAVVHVLNNYLNVRRIAIGASALKLVDERREAPFQCVLATSPPNQVKYSGGSVSWADLSWGLREDMRLLGSSLPQPVQCTVFMTPGWSMTNFGAQDANGIMHDLSWLWVLLEYFKSYFSVSVFGNPGLHAQRWVHRVKNALRCAAAEETVGFVPLPGIKVDFRLWLCRPILCLPSEYHDPRAPSLRIDSDTGLFYRYKSIEGLSSQEVASTDLNLSFSSEFQSPDAFRRESDAGKVSSRPLIDGLSFGLRYDCNNTRNHKDASLIMPFDGDEVPSCAIDGDELEVNPVQLDPPTVLKPFKQLSRELGPQVCDIPCIIEVLPLTTAIMMNFFKGPMQVNEEFAVEYDDPAPPTFSITAKVGDLRVYVLDPDLGVQLPVAVGSLSSLDATMTKFAAGPIAARLDHRESRPDDLQVIVLSHLWADYFKLGLTRSWEPLLEPFQFCILHESSGQRGRGFSIDSNSPFQLNLSSALLRVVNETLDSFSSLIKETFGNHAGNTRALRKSVSRLSPPKNRVGALLEGSMKTTDGRELNVVHEIPKALKGEDRVAFSLRNLTGQRIRIHQQTDYTAANPTLKPVVVSYLNQGESMGLTFAATISVVRDNMIQEVPYPGFSNSKGHRSQGSLQHAIDMQLPGCCWIQDVKVDTFGRKFEALTPRSPIILDKINQDWRLRNAMVVLTEVGLENGGRLVTARSLFEINNNTTHKIKLVYNSDPNHYPSGDDSLEERERDVRFRKGAVFQTDAEEKKENPEIAVLAPGESFQLPTMLVEAALELAGSHLGSIWICPDTTDKSVPFRDFSKSNGLPIDSIDASFCPRPIQLAKLVLETSLMYPNGSEEIIPPEEAKTGVHVSCPTGSRRGLTQIPFCYAIEVDRSPVVFQSESVQADLVENLDDSTKNGALDSNKGEKKEKQPKKAQRVHGPVAYTLAIHSPLVIFNLLPVSGRFELMHAIRKTVVWYADLQPGQQMPVHSIGLDAPLLLLVNLGYCRTPIGEGALVHHGGGSIFGGKEHGVGFKSIGKAVSKGTKQLGKTLTNLADSPDKRAQERLAKINTPQFYKRDMRKDNLKQQNHPPQGSLGQDGGYAPELVGGKVHSVETATYSAVDVATETTVVDGVGQRLTLNIENIRGGGGQRTVSLYCPFWIVNTTAHSLRYKQEKGTSFVCGTVISSEKDGSMPVDGSNTHYRNRYQLQSSRRVFVSSSYRDDNSTVADRAIDSSTIFAGTPGALATSPGRCDLPVETLANLIDHDMPLSKLAELAFMFNFQEEGLGAANQMLSVQLYDGSQTLNFSSDWSSGFGLETVGISRTIGLPCKEGRSLELTVSVNIAPGYLSGYTKIVRFFPRYVVFNRLERPIRLWQDSSVVRPVSEDRGSASDHRALSKESRFWRYKNEDKHFDGKINQYESLFGKAATIDDSPRVLADRSSMRLATISEGTKAYRTAFYIASLAPFELFPFHLPDSRAERQLRLDLGGEWNMTASFASEFPGEHVLRCSKARDVRLLQHVSTRVAPKYKIVLPPPDNAVVGDWDGELGVYFETDWGSSKERRIVVKGTRRGKYAYNHTDIHVGDELLRVDGVSVLRMTFEETMQVIKDRLAQIRSFHRMQSEGDQHKRGLLRRPSVAWGGKKRPHGENDGGLKPIQLSLTFRTQEERLRKLRTKAGKGRTGDTAGATHGKSTELSALSEDESNEDDASNSTDGLSVEMKSLHNTMFVILRDKDPSNPPFRIQNRSINHIIFFRQRHCEGHNWNVLLPGESLPYSWEEPMKSKKLTVRVAMKMQEIFKPMDCNSSIDDSLPDLESQSTNEGDVLGTPEEKSAVRTARLRQLLAYQYVDSEERGEFGPSVTIRLEEIGFRSLLPIPSKDANSKSKMFLDCEVDTDGGTRLLIVSDNTGLAKERNAMGRNIGILEKQISNEEERVLALQSLQRLLSGPVENNPLQADLGYETDVSRAAEDERLAAVEEEARRMVDDFPEEQTVSSRHQVVVEVLEAVGLNTDDIIGHCNPYCEVFYKGRSRSRKHFFQKRHNQRKTYFVENSFEPKWLDQVFVFDVSEDAIRVNRGNSVQVKIRNFRNAGQHTILGQASVHFASLRNQKEICGWYPLAAKLGNTETRIGTTSQLEVGRGSIKLRVQWIYTVPAMVDYYVLMSERRLQSLVRTRDGLSYQLDTAVDSAGRNHETLDLLPGGRISKLVKLRKKAGKREAKIAIGSTRKLKTAAGEHPMGSKINGRSTSNASTAKNTLKASRDRYLYAMYFQTIESRRSRQTDLGDAMTMRHGSVGLSTNELPVITEQKSPMSSSAASWKKNLESFIDREKKKASMSPRFPEGHRRRAGSLDDFFATQRSPVGIRTGGKANTPIRLRRSLLDTDAGRHLMHHQRLSLDMDDPSADESNKDLQEDPWQPSLLQGKAIFDGFRGQAPDVGILDLISVSTDVDDEAKRRQSVQRLLTMGYVFHEAGDYFHENHLPNHFRRSLFTSSAEERKTLRLYHPRLYVGTSSSMRHFKSWQAAQALFWDSELQVVVTDDSFLVRFKDSMNTSNAQESSSMMQASKAVIFDCLSVPKVAPPATRDRSRYRVETMFLSRTSFGKASRRILGSILNPGGWLTVRPIAALNLPDSYTGMLVKLRYGSQVLSSETVDATISPRWTSADFASNGKSGRRRRRSTIVGPSGGRDFAFSANDLHVQVEPQQTSGSIRVALMAERLNNKAELGVVQLPLGAAIAACIDASQDEGPAARSGIYTRWYPLIDPTLAAPSEGDMGLRGRAQDYEQSQDNSFHVYNCPCIQLALKWWPDEEENENRRPIETYASADICRVSVALVDSHRALELLNFSLSEINVSYSVTKTKSTLGLVVRWVQIDHQAGGSREPVVLAPTPAQHEQPVLQCFAIKDNLRSKRNIVSFQYIGVAVQEMDITVEETWMYEIFTFLKDVTRERKARGRRSKGNAFFHESRNIFECTEQVERENDQSLYELIQSVATDHQHKQKMYVETLILGEARFNVSYVKGKVIKLESNYIDLANIPGMTLESKTAVPSEVYAKWTNIEDATDEGRNHYNLPGLIATVFPSVSDAPLRLQGKIIEHVFETQQEIFTSLQNYYTSETMKQIYKIIGSLDFVGNPTVLLSSFASGVRDLVAAPTKAFKKHPTNVKKVAFGVGKGTISLFSHSASGLSGFSARLWASFGQAVATFSLDTEFRQWHRDKVVNEVVNLNRAWKRRGIPSAQEIFLRPALDVGVGVVAGVAGLVIAPYKGARKNGAMGFVLGCTIGTIGVFARPIVGIFDSLTHMSQNVHDIARSANVLERRHHPVLQLRLPYVFGPRGILLPYSPCVAKSVHLLGFFPPKKSKVKGETHVQTELLNMEPGIETYLIVTTARIVVIKQKLSLPPLFGWEVYLTGNVSSEVQEYGHNGCALVIKQCYNKNEEEREYNNAIVAEYLQKVQLERISAAINSVSGAKAGTAAEDEDCLLEKKIPLESFESLPWMFESGDRMLPQHIVSPPLSSATAIQPGSIIMGEMVKEGGVRSHSSRSSLSCRSRQSTRKAVVTAVDATGISPNRKAISMTGEIEER